MYQEVWEVHFNEVLSLIREVGKRMQLLSLPLGFMEILEMSIDISDRRYLTKYQNIKQK